MLIKKNDLMLGHKIAVWSEGDLVVLKLGRNVTVKFPYETALQLSQWLRVRAKEAKLRAGDTERHWSVVANLTDANETRG